MAAFLRTVRCTAAMLALIGGLLTAGPANAAVPRSIDEPVRPAAGADRDPTTGLRERVVIGRTVEGRAIVAERYGTPGGMVVLVAAAIHGNEVSGRQIARAVAAAGLDEDVPRGVDLWVVTTANPDGVRRGTRQNARGVDLNRNFPVAWRPLACPGRYCSGPSPASEPETRALARLIERSRPRVAIWWHSTGRVVDTPASGVADPAVLAAYARVTGYPVGQVGCGGVPCSGTATQFGNSRIAGATHFVVELPVDAEVLSRAEVRRHVDAVWAAIGAAR